MTFRLIVVAGDSNAVSFNSGPATLPGNLANPGGYVFTPSSAYWGVTTPTVNTGTPNAPTAWGVETPLQYHLAQLFPGDTFGIVKVAKGSTPLALDSVAVDWSPDSAGEMFDLTDATIDAAKAAYASATGLPAPEVSAVFFIGGPNDAFTADRASAYEDNLTDLFAAIRAEWMGDANGKIGFIRMTDSPNTPFNFDVRVAQWAVDQADANALSVKTIGFGVQADGFHYDAAGEVSIGQAFATMFDSWF